MAIVKEYYEQFVEMKGPSAPNAKPVLTGKVSILRFDDNRQLKIQDLAALFNEAAKDFPSYIQAKTVGIHTDHIEVELQSPLPGYKKLPPRIVGARG